MLLLIIVIVAFVLVLALDLLLPGIAFFTTGQGWAPIGEAFTAAGWDRAFAYITSGTNWDRWLVIISTSVMVILWVVLVLIQLTKGRIGQAIAPIVGVSLNLVVTYIYLAWPNPEVFQMWQRILLYVTFCFTPFSLLVQILKASKND